MLELRDISFAYDGSSVLAGVSLGLRPGEMLALVGGNGSGKSTLGRIACGALEPAEGSVGVDGATCGAGEREALRRAVGMVVQNPADQLVSTVVFDEVAFGPLNLGVSGDELRSRVSESLCAVGLGGFERRDVNALSGGEQQRLALAGVLAMRPRYLVLDEVLSMVDSAERPALRRLVRALAHEWGIGVLTVTHDPVEALSCDRIALLEAGALRWEGSPDEMALSERGTLSRVLMGGAYLDALLAAGDAGFELSRGVEPEDVASWVQTHPGARPAVMGALSGLTGSRADSPTAAEPALAARGVSAGYGSATVLSDIDLELRPGEVTLLAGRSGSGKSTLATVLAGLVSPREGSVEVRTAEGLPNGPVLRPPLPGDVALAFQSPEGQLFQYSVAAELAFGPEQLGCPAEEVRRRVASAQTAFGLEDALLERDPFALSGGQARRVALACAVSLDAPVLVLDEPTSGLDAASRRALHRRVSDLAESGKAVLVISHDLEEWLCAVDRVLLLGGGTLAWKGSPKELVADPLAFGRAGILAPESWRLAQMLSPRRDGSRQTAEECLSEAPQTVDTGRTEGEGGLVAGIDARVKIVLLFAAIAAIFLTEGLAALGAWCLLAVGLALTAGMGARRLLGALRPAALLMALVVAANLVSCDGSADLIVAGTWGLSATGAVRAATAVLRIALMLVFSLLVTATTTPVAVAEAVVRIAAPLARLGVPVEEAGMVLSLALRFIPLVSEEVRRVQLAQRSRGVRFDEDGIVARIRVWGCVLVPVMVGLFRRADRLGAAMDGRCYHGRAPVSREGEPLSRRDRAALIIGLAVAAALAAASHLMA